MGYIQAENNCVSGTNHFDTSFVKRVTFVFYKFYFPKSNRIKKFVQGIKAVLKWHVNY